MTLKAVNQLSKMIRVIQFVMVGGKKKPPNLPAYPDQSPLYVLGKSVILEAIGYRILS